MKLQTKTTIIIILIFTIFSVFILSAQSLGVIPKFKEINIEKAYDEIDEGLRVTEDEINNMSVIASDYAIWDDTYIFTNDRNDNYISDNFTKDTLANLNVSFAGIYSDNSLFSSFNTFADPEEAKLLEQALLKLGFSQSDEISGFITSGDKTYMFASKRISTTDGSQSSNYHFVFVRDYLDYTNEKLSTIPGASLEIIEFSAMTTEEKQHLENLFSTQKYESDKSHLSKKTVYEMPTEDFIVVYTYLYDVNGEPFAVMKSKTSTSIILESRNLVIQTAVFLFIIGVALALIVAFYINRSMIRPINRLKAGLNLILKQCNTTDLTNDFSVFLRNDEIGDLTRNFIKVSDDIKAARGESERVNAQLKKMAFYDTLTGLPNRSLFYDHFEQAISRSTRNNYITAVLFIDLDGFKLVNDSFGHNNGDLFLIEIGKRIKKHIRESDLVSRLGGDEYTVVCEDIKEKSDLVKIADDILVEISRDFIISGKTISVSASIGIAIFPDDGDTFEELIIKADSAMYRSKTNGNNCYAFASSADKIKDIPKIILISRLKKASEHSEFQLVYQSQVKIDANETKIFGAEVLVRWTDENGQILTPDDFINLEEETGLIIPIGQWVIEEACKTIRELERLDKQIPISVNVSIKQFKSKDLVDIVKSAIEKNHINPQHLFIETTGSIFPEDETKVLSIIKELKALGVKIVLNDFWTGYSSLSLVSRLPFDFFKVDMSFIQNLGNIEEKNLGIVIISMVETLNMQSIIEGVETREQVDYFLKNGGKIFQGRYFSEPLKKEDFFDLLQGEIVSLSKQSF